MDLPGLCGVSSTKETIEGWSRGAPSDMMLITSSPPTALSMNRALNRSWSGVDPEVLSKVDLRADSCSGVTVTDMMRRLMQMQERLKNQNNLINGLKGIGR